MQSNRRVFLCPPSSNPGGVSNFIDALLSEEDNVLRLDNPNSFMTLWMMIKCIKVRDEVYLNPSLQKKALIRDYLVSLYLRFRGVSYKVFWHGWDKSILEGFMWRNLLRKVSSGAMDSYVLNSAARFDFAMATGKRAKMYRTKSSFYMSENRAHKDNLLFSSRLVPKKRLDLALNLLSKLRFEANLTICGDGPCASKINELCNQYQIAPTAVESLGHVSGQNYYEALSSSKLFLFPTAHPEGMPNVVLEALGCQHLVFTSDQPFSLQLISNHTDTLFCFPLESWVNKSLLIINGLKGVKFKYTEYQYGIEEVRKAIFE